MTMETRCCRFWAICLTLSGVCGCGDITGLAIKAGDSETTPTVSDTGGDSATESEMPTPTGCTEGGRQMENLGRGLVAVAVEDGVYVGWRLLGCEPMETGFDLFRDDVRINDTPIIDSTNFFDADGTAASTYSVRAVVDGQAQPRSEDVGVRASSVLEVPLMTLADNFPNDGSVGDLDGDGELELVIKQEMTPLDNSASGVTGETKLEAYEMDGTLLWRINLGINIREGPHYTPFIVYDLDGDGRAEVACRTSDGTVDGEGEVIGDPDAVWRNDAGHIIAGPEYLTIFDGETGAISSMADYVPPRHPDTLTPTGDELLAVWGDNYGNRSERFLVGVAYLDGKRPSLIMARGVYSRIVVTAWNFRNGELNRQWTFDTDNEGADWEGQGNLNLSIGDIDGDGLDEIAYGAIAIDDNGDGLWNTGLGAGVAMHLSDFDPARPGMEIFGIHSGNSSPGSALIDGKDGTVIWQTNDIDVGRGVAADINPDYPGAEFWDTRSGMMDVNGEPIDMDRYSYNFLVWWDDDLLRELLDSNVIVKGDGTLLLLADGCSAINGSKATPVLSGDIIGDWREEVIWVCGETLGLFTTTILSTHRFHTLLHDPQYRVSIAWQNAGFNQPPHTSYFLGHDMEAPPLPDIYVK